MGRLPTYFGRAVHWVPRHHRRRPRTTVCKCLVEESIEGGGDYSKNFRSGGRSTTPWDQGSDTMRSCGTYLETYGPMRREFRSTMLFSWLSKQLMLPQNRLGLFPRHWILASCRGFQLIRSGYRARPSAWKPCKMPETTLQRLLQNRELQPQKAFPTPRIINSRYMKKSSGFERNQLASGWDPISSET